MLISLRWWYTSSQYIDDVVYCWMSTRFWLLPSRWSICRDVDHVTSHYPYLVRLSPTYLVGKTFRSYRTSFRDSSVLSYEFIYSHILIFRAKSFSSSIHKWKLFELRVSIVILKKILSSFIVEEKNSNIQELILICFELRTLFDLKNKETSTIKRCFRYLNKTVKIEFELRMLLHLCLREK